jgi:hypothetical protein
LNVIELKEWWQQWPLVGLVGMCLGRMVGAMVSVCHYAAQESSLVKVKPD